MVYRATFLTVLIGSLFCSAGLVAQFANHEEEILNAWGNYHKKNYKLALTIATKHLERKDSRVWLLLGVLYMDGLGVEPDYKKAKEYLELAAGQDQMDAYRQLGRLYLRGLGIKKDEKKALQYFYKAEGMGHPKAPHDLAMYFHRKDPKKQGGEALHYMKRAAFSGYEVAMRDLGSWYLEGIHDNAPYIRGGLRWYLYAAREGDKDAYNRLKELSNGTSKLALEAKRTLLILLMMQGKANSKDQESISLRKKLLSEIGSFNEPDNTVAYYCHIRSLGEADQKIVKANLKEAATGFSPDPFAKYLYGFNLRGTDPDRSFKLIYEAALFGDDYYAVTELNNQAQYNRHPLATYYLGQLYLKGPEHHRRISRGREVLKRAISKNYFQSIILLATFDLSRLDQPQHHLSAFKLLGSAAKKGSAGATIELGSLIAQGDHPLFVKHPPALKPQDGYQMIRKMALRGEPRAWVAASRCEWKGFGTGKSILQAYRSYEKSKTLENRASILKFKYKRKPFPKAGLERLELYREVHTLAEKKDPAAMTFLAYILLVDPLFGSNLQSLDYAKATANLNYTPGMALLGYMYSQGRGVERDAKLAKSWFEKAYKKGDLVAGLYLIPLMANTTPVEVIEEIINKGVALKIPEALWIKADQYLLEDKKNYTKAVEIYSKALKELELKAFLKLDALAVKDVPEALLELAKLYFQKNHPLVHHDKSLAYNFARYAIRKSKTKEQAQKIVDWLNTLAKSDDVGAIETLYRAYLKDEIIKDLPTSIRWLQRACDLGSSLGYRDMAYHAVEGYSVNGKVLVPKNESLAKSYAQKVKDTKIGCEVLARLDLQALSYFSCYNHSLRGAKLGSPICMFFLGHLYFEGRGVPKPDLYESYAWLHTANKLSPSIGNIDIAQNIKKDILEALDKKQIEEAKALGEKYFKKYGAKKVDSKK